MRVKTVKLGPFKGVNNISDPMSLGTKHFTSANNVDITDNKTTKTRGGYIRLRSGAYSAVFASPEEDATYATTSNSLVRFNDDLNVTETVIASLTSTKEVKFVEINKELFYSNGIDSGIVTRENVLFPLKWAPPPAPVISLLSNNGDMDAGEFQVCTTYIMKGGRESGPSPAALGCSADGDSLVISGFNLPDYAKAQLVYVKPPKSTVFQLLCEVSGTTSSWFGDANELMDDLLSEISMPHPDSVVDMKLWRGQVAWMEYVKESDITNIYFSEQLVYHVFRSDSYISLKGEGTELAPHPSGLFIKMRKSLHVYDEESLRSLASFGGPPGDSAIVDDDGSLLIWTDKGYCGLTPFVRLMDKQVSVSKSEYATGTIIERNGEKRIVALLQSTGSPTNARDN